VVLAVFLAFPALSVPLLQTFKGAQDFPPVLTYVLVFGGAAAWALASFTASSAWLSLGLAASLAGGLHYLSTLGLVRTAVVGPATVPLVLVGLISAPAFTSFDPILILGLLAGMGSKGLQHLQETARIEVFALVTLGVVALLTSPGLIGHSASQALSPLSTYAFQLPGVALALLLAFIQPSLPSSFLAGLTAALLLARFLSKAPEPTEAARQNARSSHWLLAALLATLSILLTFEINDQGKPAGLTAITFLLVGTGVAVLSTSFLAATARVWGPVRSGEYQMVTLDFLALCGYFIMPLLFVAHLGLQQLLPLLPPSSLLLPSSPHLEWVLHLLQPLERPVQLLLLSYPLVPALLLGWMVVATQEAFEESSVLWAHWLIRTYTLGALDTKHVALVVRLEALLRNVPEEGGREGGRGGGALPALLKEAGVPVLNIFVSPSLASSHGELCAALSKEGHVLGLETAAGPFAFPPSVMHEVSAGVAALKKTQANGGGKGEVGWYLGTGGHRNPWALWRASTMNMHFVAPAHRVVLGDNAGVALCELLDPWCKGGVVMVEVGGGGGGGRGVHLLATLKDLRERAEEGGYVLDALSVVCPEVQPMVLPVEGGGGGGGGF
jgi:hypothetical protein